MYIHHILLITILGIYLYLLLTNIGEEEKVKTNNLSKFFIIILLTVPLFFIYIPKGGLHEALYAGVPAP